MAASINLKVTSDFAQATADLKKFNANMSPAEQAKLQKYFDTYKDKGIDTFLTKQKRLNAAITATSGKVEANQREFKALQREMQRLITKGIDPQDDALKPLIARYKQLEKEVKDAGAAQKKQNSESRFGIKSFTDLAAAGTVAIMAAQRLFSVGKELVDLYGIQEQAEARLEQTIKSTGSAANLTADELTDMATALQGVTKFGDEAIIGAESLLLTFKNIGEDTFPRALESILDVSEAMGTGLKESSIQLGKALNDPVGGISALTRVGIQFTQEQKDLIKEMVETNNVAGAQGIILDELESQFGGVARAAADTATGAMTQFGNVAGDLKEQLGRATANGLQPFVLRATEIVQALVEMEKETNDLNEAIDNFQKGTADGEQTVKALNQQLVTEVVSLAALTDAQNLNIAGSKEAVRIQEERIEKTRLLIGVASRAAALEAQGGRLAAETAEANRVIAEQELALGEQNIKALDELEKRRVDALTTDEKRLENIQKEIDQLSVFRDSASQMGVENQAIQNLINDLFRERAILQADEVTAINGVMTAEDVLAQARQDEFEILIGREENRARLREEEIDGIEAVAERERELIQERIAAYESYSSAVMGIFNAIDDLQSAKSAAELARLEAQGASEEELAQRKKELEREAAIRGKKIALFEVAINTASAIIKALVNPGGFAGLALSALAAVTGGIQAAAINAQPIPTAQTGTASPIIVPDTGRHDNVAVMAGAGEQVSVTPRGEAGMTQNISVSLNERVLIDFVNDNIESGDIRITTDNIQGGIAV